MTRTTDEPNFSLIAVKKSVYFKVKKNRTNLFPDLTYTKRLRMNK
jgi:hypothetical protein